MAFDRGFECCVKQPMEAAGSGEVVIGELVKT